MLIFLKDRQDMLRDNILPHVTSYLILSKQSRMYNVLLPLPIKNKYPRIAFLNGAFKVVIQTDFMYISRVFIFYNKASVYNIKL